MNKEEVHLATIKKFGACPIIEYDIPLYSHRQLLDFTTETCIEGNKQIQRLHQELDLRCEHVKIKDRLLEEVNKEIDRLNSWNIVSKAPEFGGEYNVTVDLEDGQHPLTCTYDYNVKEKTWTDPVTGIVSKNVLAWRELPSPADCTFIETKHKIEPIINSLSDFEGLAYGQCIHGENLAMCEICNSAPENPDGEWVMNN